MLTGAMAAIRARNMVPPADRPTVTLLTRLAGEGGYAAPVNWTACIHPAEADDLLIGGAVIGERWKVFELFLETQTVTPKEEDQISDGVSKWTLRSVGTRQNGNEFWCRGLYAGT